MPGTDIYFILYIKRVLDRFGWGAPFIIKKSISCTVYQSLYEMNVIVTGRVDSQAFQVSSFQMKGHILSQEEIIGKYREKIDIFYKIFQNHWANFSKT